MELYGCDASTGYSFAGVTDWLTGEYDVAGQPMEMEGVAFGAAALDSIFLPWELPGEASETADQDVFATAKVVARTFVAFSNRLCMSVTRELLNARYTPFLLPPPWQSGYVPRMLRCSSSTLPRISGE